MQEDGYTEFKSSFADAVIESLVAFENTSGGKLLIGVNNSGLPVKDVMLGQESIQQWIHEINKT